MNLWRHLKFKPQLEGMERPVAYLVLITMAQFSIQDLRIPGEFPGYNHIKQWELTIAVSEVVHAH